jgi:hypothetical protein
MWYNFVRVITVKNSVLWVVTSFRLVGRYQLRGVMRRETVIWNNYWVETFLHTFGRQYICSKFMFIECMNTSFHIIKFIHKKCK